MCWLGFRTIERGRRPLPRNCARNRRLPALRSRALPTLVSLIGTVLCLPAGMLKRPRPITTRRLRFCFRRLLCTCLCPFPRRWPSWSTSLATPLQALVPPHRMIRLTRPRLARATLAATATPSLDADCSLEPSWVTVPVELPAAWVAGGAAALSKSALTARSLVRVTSQDAVPEQPPPDQPLKCESDPGSALSTICEPWANVVEQVEPHSIPAGLLLTVPEPEPLFVIDSACVACRVTPVIDDCPMLPAPSYATARKL